MEFIKSTDGWLKWSVIFLISMLMVFNKFLQDLFGNPNILIDATRVFYFGFFPCIGIWLVLCFMFSTWFKDNESKKEHSYKLGKLFELAIVLAIGVGYYIAFNK